jgi:hypothetical protein
MVVVVCYSVRIHWVISYRMSAMVQGVGYVGQVRQVRWWLRVLGGQVRRGGWCWRVVQVCRSGASIR